MIAQDDVALYWDRVADTDQKMYVLPTSTRNRFLEYNALLENYAKG